MRSHGVSWKLVTILVWAMMASCGHQKSASEEAIAVPSAADTVPATVSLPTNKAEKLPSSHPSTADSTLSESPESDSSQAGQIAVVTAQNPESQVNVRSLPSPDADPLGYGLVGDVARLGRSEVAEDGYTWHYVMFEETSAVGWMREDFLDIQEPAAPVETPMVTTEDVLKDVLDERCGGPQAIEAYFMTRSQIIYLCKVRDDLLYLSQEKGTEQVIVVEDVRAAGGGYVVVNGRYDYRLDSRAFVVIRVDDDGEAREVLQEPIIYSERY